MKNLIFFTSQFPFGEGETFVENEFPFLAQAFDKIFIITNEVTVQDIRQVPANVVVICVPYKASLRGKIRAILSFFNPAIQSELKFIKHRHLPFNKNILSILVGSYAHAVEAKQFINKLVTAYKLELSSLYIYSYWMNNISAGSALFKKQHPETKAICRAHGWDVYFERHKPPYLPLRNFILENLDACYCVSENGKWYLENLIDQNIKNKIKLARLGSFNADSKKNPYGTGEFSIVSCSNIIPLKRIHLIIESLALIKDISITWTHFGAGEEEDEIKKYAAQILSHMHNIKYRFMGQVSNADVLNYYANKPVDLFINVSETEGLPVSIMEAFSFGIPAMAMDVGGISEIIKDGENGILLKPDTPVAKIAEALCKFHALSEEQKMNFRRRAFATWEEKFNAQKNYGKFIAEIYTL